MVVEREVDDREPGAMIRVRFALVPEVLAPRTIREARVGGVVLVPLGDQLCEPFGSQLQHLRRGVRLQ